MDDRTKLDLIQALKTEICGVDENKDPQNCRYISERNAVESTEERLTEAEKEELARQEAIKKEKQKKEEEEELFRALLLQHRSK